MFPRSHRVPMLPACSSLHRPVGPPRATSLDLDFRLFAASAKRMNRSQVLLFPRVAHSCAWPASTKHLFFSNIRTLGATVHAQESHVSHVVSAASALLRANTGVWG